MVASSVLRPSLVPPIVRLHSDCSRKNPRTQETEKKKRGAVLCSFGAPFLFWHGDVVSDRYIRLYKCKSRCEGENLRTVSESESKLCLACASSGLCISCKPALPAFPFPGHLLAVQELQGNCKENVGKCKETSCSLLMSMLEKSSGMIRMKNRPKSSVFTSLTPATAHILPTINIHALILSRLHPLFEQISNKFQRETEHCHCPLWFLSQTLEPMTTRQGIFTLW